VTAAGRVPAPRRAARAVLVRAVRGGAERGGTWGEAVLGEFDATAGTWDAFRWTASGLRVAWRERRARNRLAGHARTRRWVRPGIVTVLAVVALAAAWLVAGVRYVPTTTMDPTLHSGDRILVDKIMYRWRGLHHGDLVLVDSARLGIGGTPSPIVRRVLGLPGDRIACQDGHYLRGSAELDRPRPPAGQALTCPATTVPPGQVHLVGDNTVAAIDSRQFGPVPQDAVVARVVTRIWG